MNITTSFVFYAVVLTIALIASDILYLRLRQKNFDEGKPPSSFFRKRIYQIKQWVDAGKLQIQKLMPMASLRSINNIDHHTSQDNDIKIPNTPQDHPIVSNIQITSEENGKSAEAASVVRVQITADIPDDTIVHITLQTINGKGQTKIWQESLGQPKYQIPSNQSKLNVPLPLLAIRKQIQNFRETLTLSKKWETSKIHGVLFTTAIVIYLLVVSIGIDRFPIYFFTDEAVHANLAADFWNNGLKNYDGEFLPTYFSINPSFGLNSVSVYLQVIPYVLFGKSIVITRMVSAFITLLGAILTGLLLKQVFKVSSYWLGMILLLVTPAWFLHARTAFEYIEVASFFAAMIYFYNLYRQGKDKYIYATVIAGALTFYTHGLGQILAGLTVLLFFISDFRYHFQPERRKVIFYAVGLAFLLFVPYIRYNIDHASMISAQIRQRDSYWVNGNLTLINKLSKFFAEYLFSFSPSFWFVPNTRDIVRHVMKGYGNILLVMLPFATLGIIRAIRNFQKPEYRSILIAFMVAPVPASIVAIGTPRILWMIIPWTILITLGLDLGVHWLDKNTWLKLQISQIGLFILLSLTSFFMLSDALYNGPTWFQDYGLYGMQYGAKQVFQETIIPWLSKDPTSSFIVSPSWANGTDQFASFFLPKGLTGRMSFGSPGDLTNNPARLTSNTIFVLTSDEFANLSKDERFKDIQVQKTVSYPNGKPGFYLLTLKFADNIDQIVTEQHLVNRTPIEDKVSINGQEVRIIHSPLSSGNINDTFDNDPNTLTRVIEANPDIFDLYSEPPITTNSVTIQTGSLSDFTVNISLYAPGATEPVTYSQTFKGLPPDPLVTIPFDKGPAKSGRIYIEIKDNTSGETSQIHVRTIQFK